MKRRITKLLSLSYSSLHSQSQIHHQPLSKPIPPTSSFSTFSKSQRDSMSLQQFKERKLKGSSRDSKPVAQSFDSNDEKILQKGLKIDTMVVGNFEELIGDIVVITLGEIGQLAPSEIQGVVFPTILYGKSLLLCSAAHPDRATAYLLPLIQLLRQDRELHGWNLKHPSAVVLCASEKKAEECYKLARIIYYNTKNSTSSDNANLTMNSCELFTIGLILEILQYIEKGTVVPAELKYLVLDEADSMLGSNLRPEITKIIKSLQHHESKSRVEKLQTIMAIETIAEVLGENSPIVKRLEHDHAGNISTLSIEMEETYVFHLTESLRDLRERLEQAMNSL